MASKKMGHTRLSVMILLIFLCLETNAKLSDNRTNEDSAEVKSVPSPKKFQSEGGAALMFADDFKQTLERYLFGICPQSYKSRWSQMALGAKNKNITAPACDLDTEQLELPGRLATLALRAHSATRSDCLRLGAVLANTLGDLARTAANKQAFASAASKEEMKKRKLSKSQKAKIQAKQRTALAVKKKAAAVAAAAAAKIAS